MSVCLSVTVSEPFHKILTVVAGCRGQTVEAYVLDQLLCTLDCDLEASVAELLGMPYQFSYRKDLVSMLEAE